MSVYLLLVLGMISNGIVFGPPSEWLFYEAFVRSDQSVMLFCVLAIANTIGHTVFFLIVLTCPRFLCQGL